MAVSPLPVLQFLWFGGEYATDVTAEAKLPVIESEYR
jgi:hypothetical protein